MNKSIKSFLSISILCTLFNVNTTQTMQLFRDLDKKEENKKELKKCNDKITNIKKNIAIAKKILETPQSIRKKLKESLKKESKNYSHNDNTEAYTYVLRATSINHKQHDFLKQVKNLSAKEQGEKLLLEIVLIENDIKKDIEKCIKTLIKLGKDRVALLKNPNKNINKNKKLENKKKEEKKEKIKCVICQENIKKNEKCKALLCGHTFHTNCITQWELSGQPNSKKCPICKRSATDMLKKASKIDPSLQSPANNNSISINNRSTTTTTTTSSQITAYFTGRNPWAVNQNNIDQSNVNALIQALRGSQTTNNQNTNTQTLSREEKLRLALELTGMVNNPHTNNNITQTYLTILKGLKKLNLIINSLDYDQLINTLENGSFSSGSFPVEIYNILFPEIKKKKILENYINTLLNN